LRDAFADVVGEECRAGGRTRIRAAMGAALVAGVALGVLAFVIASRPDARPPAVPIAAADVPAPASQPASAPLPALVAPLVAPDPVPLVSAGDSFLAASLSLLPRPPRADAFAVASPLPGAVAPAPPPPVVEAEIARGETLASALAGHGVSAGTVAVIARELRPHFDFRRARPGHHYRLERDAQGALVSFEYRVSPLEQFGLRARGDGRGYETWRSQRDLLRQQVRLAGVVSTTLYDAIRDLGESPQLAADFASIFAWDVDFARAIQRGDEFRMLYERTYAPRAEGDALRYLGPGRILAARFKSGAREVEAVYYETEPGHGAYYRRDGTSVKQTFLAAPLDFSRITSSFTTARFHPILRVTRPHPGIDYAAPHGTPVWAVADGRVKHAGWAGGFGRLVKIQHADGYETYYAHLSRFASNLRVGSTVRQKQLVGYVGSSGLSTGPHVCFRITKNGRYVNPSSVRLPSGDRVPVRQRQDFETVREARLAQLGPAPIGATQEAM
jgi:murein DD-endopeptidase MepM/ murein hydrolase activator NlpD